MVCFDANNFRGNSYIVAQFIFKIVYLKET